MIAYKTKKRSVTRSAVKWILAGIVFVCALSITFNDVYGMTLN